MIVVESKKDFASLKALGFDKIYSIHNTGVFLRESTEQIVEWLEKKDKVCNLTDFYKKGKHTYLLLKREFSR